MTDKEKNDSTVVASSDHRPKDYDIVYDAVDWYDLELQWENPSQPGVQRYLTADVYANAKHDSVRCSDCDKLFCNGERWHHWRV